MKEKQSTQTIQPGTLRLNATNVYERNYEAVKSGFRNICNQGGSGSSKTWSIAQVIVALCFEGTGKRFSVVRKTLPDLKKSAMLDFFKILNEYGLYNEKYHNRTDNIYKLYGNDIEFFGLEQGQKTRGARRDYLWGNEINEIGLDAFRQLSMRTRIAIFLDYNPSDQYHWIYDEIHGRDDTCEIRSTYQDNPFLSEQERREIEGYKDKDENYWRVFGLGERGISHTTIFNHWQNCDKLPGKGEVIYGLDFGWSNPTALVKVEVYDNDIYVEEKIYLSQLTDPELIQEIKHHCYKTDLIYADSEDPQKIHNIKAAGYNVKGFDKAAGSVRAGIMELQKRGFYITSGSVNIKKEVKSYSWRVKDGQPLSKEEPVKLNDHALDGIRGAVYTHLKSRQSHDNWGFDSV